MKSAKSIQSTFQQRVMEGLCGAGRSAGGLQMAPMIDVIFLLLTFFVLTARFRLPEAFVPIALSSPDSSIRVQMIEPLILYLTSAGEECLAEVAAQKKVILSRESPETGLAVLAETVEQLCRSQQRRPQDPVELVCSDDVQWDYVVKVYDLLRVLGLEQITFVMTELDDGAE